jgi:GntR family transcriptional regulator
MIIDANSHVPIFEQIAGSIRTGIANGIYRSGEMLPSLRGLALAVTVNPNTVKRAYERLEQEGLIVSRRGVGLFVTEEAVGIAKASAGVSVQLLFDGAVAAARTSGLSDSETKAIFEKTLKSSQAGGNKP